MARETEACHTWFLYYASEGDNTLWQGRQPPDGVDIQNVLVVDDDTEAGILTSQRLNRFAIDTMLVHGNNVGSRTADLMNILPDEEVPDLVILDFNMVDIDGLQLAQNIREKWLTCLIVCITSGTLADSYGGGAAMEEMRKKAKELGIPVAKSLDWVTRPKKTLQDLIIQAHTSSQ